MPQPQTTPAGTGHDHAWVSGRAARAGVTRRAVGALRDPDNTVYSTDAPPPEPERVLIAVGGETSTDRPLFGLRVWSEEYQRTLQVNAEVLTWFARHMAEADFESKNGIGGRGSDARDRQFIMDGAAACYTNLLLALEGLREKLREPRVDGEGAM